MSKKDIVFVTGNANKLEEVKQIFKNFYKGAPVPFNVSTTVAGRVDLSCPRSEYQIFTPPLPFALPIYTVIARDPRSPVFRFRFEFVLLNMI